MRTLVIIGAGFSGTLTAVNLLRRAARAIAEGRPLSPQPLRLVLVERTGRFGAGVAYGTNHYEHLLNVPTARMSAIPDAPDDFLNWARSQRPTVEGYSFLPRRTYRDYIEHLLADARRGCPQIDLTLLKDDVRSVRPDGNESIARVEFAASPPIEANRVVLAPGNYAPLDVRAAGDAIHETDFYVRDPWDDTRYQGIDPTWPVLIIGTGLTAVDIVLRLATSGHTGTIHAVSRHGLMPQAHLRSPVTPLPSSIEALPAAPRPLLRAICRRVREAEQGGGDWRAVVDGLRGPTAAIWQRFTLDQRRQFFRHVRHFWEIHRHRIAPDVAAVFNDLVQSGRVRIHAARIAAYRLKPDGVTVEIHPRAGHGRSPITLDVHRVINCTGPNADFTRVTDPLIQQMLADGLIRPDPLRIGLDCTQRGALIGRDGSPSTVLFTVGPPQKPLTWESTAVPELRGQAADLASVLFDALQ